MPQNNPTNPLRWLLAELPNYLEQDDLIEVIERYEKNKARYYLTVKIRDAERRIRIYERSPDRYDAKNLPRWQEKLAKLKTQEADLDNNEAVEPS